MENYVRPQIYATTPVEVIESELRSGKMPAPFVRRMRVINVLSAVTLRKIEDNFLSPFDVMDVHHVLDRQISQDAIIAIMDSNTLKAAIYTGDMRGLWAESEEKPLLRKGFEQGWIQRFIQTPFDPICVMLAMRAKLMLDAVDEMGHSYNLLRSLGTGWIDFGEIEGEEPGDPNSYIPPAVDTPIDYPDVPTEPAAPEPEYVPGPGEPGYVPPGEMTPSAPGYTTTPGSPGYVPPGEMTPSAPGYTTTPGSPGYVPPSAPMPGETGYVAPVAPIIPAIPAADILPEGLAAPMGLGLWPPTSKNVTPTPIPRVCISGTIGANYEGYVQCDGDYWLPTRNAENGTYANPGPYVSVFSPWVSVAGGPTIYREFYEFSIPSADAGYKITEAKLVITGLSGGANIENLSLQKSTYSHPLSIEDYNAFEGTPFAVVAWQVSALEFVFNAAGLAYLNSCLDGVARLCLREYEHDYIGTEPTAASYAELAAINYDDPTKTPELRVVYC